MNRAKSLQTLQAYNTCSAALDDAAEYARVAEMAIERNDWADILEDRHIQLIALDGAGQHLARQLTEAIGVRTSMRWQDVLEIHAELGDQGVRDLVPVS